MQITNYKPFLTEILKKIQLARYEMLKTVNRETVHLYWNIGKMVSEKVKQEQWGKSIVEQLSKDLQAEFPGIKGFSTRNIWNMKSFYETYHQNQFLQPLVAEIGWVQNCIIIEKCKDERAREFYIRDVGQVQMYLSLVNKQVKQENHNGTIGIIICRSKNRTVVEYMLAEVKQPIGVATYNHYKNLPENIAQYLPTEEQIIKRLDNLIE